MMMAWLSYFGMLEGPNCHPHNLDFGSLSLGVLFKVAAAQRRDIVFRACHIHFSLHGRMEGRGVSETSEDILGEELTAQIVRLTVWSRARPSLQTVPLESLREISVPTLVNWWHAGASCLESSLEPRTQLYFTGLGYGFFSLLTWQEVSDLFYGVEEDNWAVPFSPSSAESKSSLSSI